MRSSLFCLVASAFLVRAAVAAEADDPSESVIVSASRIPTPESEIASSVSIITAADIAAKDSTTLTEILADVPGLNLVQTGGPGGKTQIFMRGANANQVKVLIDGIEVDDPSSPDASFDPGQFLTGDIDRVEILRGPQSGLYGGDAIGGVINIVTKSGNGPLALTAGVEAGSFGTFNQNAEINGSYGALHYAATFEHLHADDTPVTPLAILAPGEKRNGDSDDSISASAKLGYDVAPDFDLGLVARYAYARLFFTGDNFFTGFPDDIRSESDTLQYYARASGRLVLFDGAFEQTLGVAYSSVASTNASPESPNDYFSGDRWKADWQGNVKISDSETLVLGAEIEREATRLPVVAAIATDSAYAELQSVIAGDFFDTVSLRYDNSDRFGGEITYRIAPGFLIEATGTRLKASVGTGFKGPTLSELFESFPAFGFFGNPDLKPEKSLGYDVGFEQRLDGDALSFGATYFRNAIDNLIDVNDSFSSYANIGRAETDGVESFVAYRPWAALSFRADYTFTEANDEILHQELPRRPKHKVTFDARWQAMKNLSIDADVRWVSSWIDTNRLGTIPRLTAPGYATADLSANYDLNEHLTLYGRISNLWDAVYQDPYGFLKPGRGIYLGIKAKI